MRALLFAALLALPPAAAAEKALSVCDDVTDPMTLDPQKEFSEKNHTVIQQMFEGLVRFEASGTIRPALATAWRRLDDRTVQFDLRRGVRFQNGEEFDAASVKFSLERYLNPVTGFPALGFIDSLDHAVVVDSRTVNIVTKYPDGLLLNRLAGFIVMVPPKYYGEQPEAVLRERPVGSGPFKFKSWEKGTALVLEAYRGYWDPALPRVDSLSFRFIPAERQVEELLAGRLDVLTSLPGTRTLDVQKNPRTAVLKRPTYYTVAANFNTGRKPLSDPKVREALNLAVDRADLVRYDIFGNGTPVGTLSLPGEFGHDDTVEPYPHDPARARVLLREAGYPEGFTLKALLKLNAERTGRILARQLAEVGVKLDVTTFKDSEMFEYYRDKGRWDISIYDCPDPMHHAFFIRSIFLGGGSPFSLAADAGVDERIARLVTALDPEEQRSVSRELDRYIRAGHLALPTYQRNRTYGLRKGVLFEPYVSGMPYFYETSIAAP
ncbi:ABC transporter substrate-binding protein [bacterium]|nr:MAG: ABC transporter substrate-binding protein [bacterium]